MRSNLETLIRQNDSVLDTAAVLTCMTRAQLRRQISSGRWQRPFDGVVVTHSGPLTDLQKLRVAMLRCGPQAVLAGLTAARLDKFTWLAGKKAPADDPIYVLTPPGRRRRPAPLDLEVIVHQSRMLTELDVHPLRQPKRTRIARSLVDAASWIETERGAMAVLAAGVQQGRTRVTDLRSVLDRNETVHRRRLMYDILGDIEGGAEALSELDFTRKVIRQFRLPEPSRQVGRRDSRDKQRWIDVIFDEYNLAVEIDGAQHMEPLDQWDDMERDNDLNIDGYRVLRFPAWLVRRNPEHVAKKILEALRRGGYRG